MLRSIKELNGYKINAIDGDVGKVDGFFFEDEFWSVRYVVVKTGNWLQNRKVLISPVALKSADWAAKKINVDLTQKQVEESPDVDADKPVYRQHEIRLHQHYRWPYYWTEAGLHGLSSSLAPVFIKSLPVKNDEQPKDGDPSLRSTNEIFRYRIDAIDTDIGSVDDFILDDDFWVLRYMIVSTRSWLPGRRKVLIAPHWIEEINWAEATVKVELTEDEIKNSPEYDPEAPINREWEERLYDFHGRPKYWV